MPTPPLELEVDGNITVTAPGGRELHLGGSDGCHRIHRLGPLRYQGTGGTGRHTNGTVSGFPYTDSFVNNFRIIGQGTGNDLISTPTGSSR